MTRISKPSQPLISVLLPVYNGEIFIRDSIQSVLDQTFTNFELIVVDDGSSDNSREIVQGFEDKRIRLLINRKNAGVSASLNIALDVSNGKYIARQDADDISMPNRLEKQVEYLENEEKVGVVGSQIKVKDENGSEMIHELPMTHSLIVWWLFFGNALAHPSVMMKKDLVSATGGYRSKYDYVEDLDLWHRLLGKSDFANLDERLVIYRSHPMSTSRAKMKLQNDLANQRRCQSLTELIGENVEMETYENLQAWMLGYALDKSVQRSKMVEVCLQLVIALAARGWIDSNDKSLSQFITDKIVIMEKNKPNWREKLWK